jgi:hypothetical protein
MIKPSMVNNDANQWTWFRIDLMLLARDQTRGSCRSRPNLILVANYEAPYFLSINWDLTSSKQGDIAKYAY